MPWFFFLNLSLALDLTKHQTGHYLSFRNYCNWDVNILLDYRQLPIFTHRLWYYLCDTAHSKSTKGMRGGRADFIIFLFQWRVWRMTGTGYASSWWTGSTSVPKNKRGIGKLLHFKLNFKDFNFVLFWICIQKCVMGLSVPPPRPGKG